MCAPGAGQKTQLPNKVPKWEVGSFIDVDESLVPEFHMLDTMENLFGRSGSVLVREDMVSLVEHLREDLKRRQFRRFWRSWASLWRSWVFSWRQ
jgi:hypothetical protein